MTGPSRDVDEEPTEADRSTPSTDTTVETGAPSHPLESPATPPDSPECSPPPSRVDTLELGYESFVIYDRTNTEAWLQSDHAVALPTDDGGPTHG